VNQKLSHEAVEWFVLNESGAAGDAELAQRWEQWCAESGNRAEYVLLLQLAQDLCALPPPSEVSRKELLKDIAAEEGESGMSRAG
jgi:ferric-dicitrate binding protein FerR (iron transport regulator)